MSSDQSVDRGRGIEHLLCEPAIVSDLDSRLEAARALHRALRTLSGIEPLKTVVQEETKNLSDVVDAAEVLETLGRLRTAVELARFPRPEQRRLSLSLLDTLSEKLRSSAVERG